MLAIINLEWYEFVWLGDFFMFFRSLGITMEKVDD